MVDGGREFISYSIAAINVPGRGNEPFLELTERHISREVVDQLVLNTRSEH